MSTRKIPLCFASNPGPQEQAENDCANCSVAYMCGKIGMELAEARLYQNNNYEGLMAAWAERDRLREEMKQLKQSYESELKVGDSYSKEVGELRAEIDRLKKENIEKERLLENHAEDWAMCGIPHEGQLVKNLILSDENHKLRVQLSDASSRREQWEAWEAVYAKLSKLPEFIATEQQTDTGLNHALRVIDTLVADKTRLTEELRQIRNVLMSELDRDKDDTTTFHLAVIACNTLAQLRAQLSDTEKEIDAFKSNNRYMRGHTAGYEEAQAKYEAQTPAPDVEAIVRKAARKTCEIPDFFARGSLNDQTLAKLTEHENQIRIAIARAGHRADSELMDYLASMWDSQGHGHHICGRFIPNVSGSFRDAVRAHKALCEAARKEDRTCLSA